MSDNDKKIKDKYLFKKVRFVSGNFIGLTGFCKEIEFNSNHRNAIYGIRITFDLSNGDVGYAHKSEHFELLK